jgi:hypothetical protein
MSPKAAKVVALLLRKLGKTLNYDKDQFSATNTSTPGPRLMLFLGLGKIRIK